MKKFLFLVAFAVLGAVITLVSAANEHSTIGGAWVGVVYSAVAAAGVALFENQALEKPGKEIGMDVVAIILGAILCALAYTIF